MEHAAQYYASKKHNHQRRRNTPTIEHVQQVVGILHEARVDDTTIICVGWLHDTIEDTDVSYDDIQERFGHDIANCVSALSKDTRLPKEKRVSEYLIRLSKAPWQAKVVKLADIVANLQSLTHSMTHSMTPPSKARKKAARLRTYLEAIQDDLTLQRVPGLPGIQRKLDGLLRTHGLEPVTTT